MSECVGWGTSTAATPETPVIDRLRDAARVRGVERPQANISTTMFATLVKELNATPSLQVQRSSCLATKRTWVRFDGGLFLLKASSTTPVGSVDHLSDEWEKTPDMYVVEDAGLIWLGEHVNFTEDPEYLKILDPNGWGGGRTMVVYERWSDSKNFGFCFHWGGPESEEAQFDEAPVAFESYEVSETRWRAKT